jgi:alkanesulfonate monooxygenase
MDFFAVSPRLSDPEQFLDAFERTVALADRHGLRGLLLFEGARVPFDPWVLAQRVLTRSTSLTPLIAAGPAYISAAQAARRVTNLHQLYGRPPALNLVAGAEAHTGNHTQRYQALRQFALILDENLGLLDGTRLGTGSSDRSPVAGWSVAGHSPDAAALANELGVTNLRMLPGSLTEDVPAGCGLNFGVVTRPTTVSAWADARRLFPAPAGAERVARRAAELTDSRWKQQLLTDAPSAPGYWRIPAQAMRADAPYYVGSYDEVADLFTACRERGVHTVLLDLPPADVEYQHLMHTMRRAQSAGPLARHR